ncbi:MAG: hypothetical protein L3J53_01155 [Proteobacteria bacterium]|nr:hypothetical protein [Pseudomonadota bacterium]
MNKILLLFIIALTSVVNSKDYIGETIDYIDTELKAEQKIKSSNALIKSSTDLAYFSQLTYENFPLNYLSPKDKDTFIKSLTFSDKGLSSYNYQILDDLADFNKVYKILSLFGMEKATSLTISSPSKFRELYDDGDSVGAGLTIFDNEWCSSRATCTALDSSRCIADNC